MRCACGAQRARAEKAEAERDRLAATVERVRELATILNDDLDAAALSEALDGEGGTDQIAAAHDREVAARTLREAAEKAFFDGERGRTLHGYYVLQDRADAIEKGKVDV